MPNKKLHFLYSDRSEGPQLSVSSSHSQETFFYRFSGNFSQTYLLKKISDYNCGLLQRLIYFGSYSLGTLYANISSMFQKIIYQLKIWNDKVKLHA